MSSNRSDLAAIEHNDPGHQFQDALRDRMRDNECRPSGQEFLQRLMDQAFALRIDGTGRLVENQDLRISKNGPRQGNPLSLTAGQSGSLLANSSLKALRQLIEKLRDISSLRGLFDFRRKRVGPTIADILEDRVVKQQSFLSDDSNSSPEIVKRTFPQIDAVQQDATQVGIKITRQQIHESGFAAAVLTHDGKDLSHF